MQIVAMGKQSKPSSKANDLDPVRSGTSLIKFLIEEVPTIINGPEVISFLSDKAKLFKNLCL